LFSRRGNLVGRLYAGVEPVQRRRARSSKEKMMTSWVAAVLVASLCTSVLAGLSYALRILVARDWCAGDTEELDFALFFASLMFGLLAGPVLIARNVRAMLRARHASASVWW
jgi:hypothetical protein